MVDNATHEKLEQYATKSDESEIQECACTKSKSGHQWDGCKCSACGKTRDECHDWSGVDYNYCHICGAARCRTCGCELIEIDEEIADPPYNIHNRYYECPICRRQF